MVFGFIKKAFKGKKAEKKAAGEEKKAREEAAAPAKAKRPKKEKPEEKAGRKTKEKSRATRPPVKEKKKKEKKKKKDTAAKTAEKTAAKPAPPAPEPEPEAPEPVETGAEEGVEEGVEEAGEEKKGWLKRLASGLSKSSSKLTEGIKSAVVSKKRLDEETLEELEDLLITSDLGVETAARLTQSLARKKFDQEVTGDEIRETFAEDIAAILKPVVHPLALKEEHKPQVILVCGVNGSGKTTTIGKMAKQLKDADRTVVLAACDTFRAAAVEQLEIWGERTGAPVISRETGADAAGLAYDALEQAKREDADVLIIDTAGRLQNKSELMAELQKIIRVIKKIDETAPHDTVLVLDGTVGQNAHSQVQIFKEMVNISGLIITKLDGTAKGGVVVSLAEKFAIPLHAVGVGETVEDLRDFEAEAFARSLLGLADQD